MTPITKMTCVGSNVWCACGSQIKVYSESGGLLELLQSVQITTEGNQIAKGITTMVATEDHVWVAVQGSSIVKCYNQSNYEIVCEANVAPEVAKILAGKLINNVIDKILYTVHNVITLYFRRC